MLTRRQALQAALGVAGAPLGAALGSAAPAAPVIDTHTHFYDPDRPEGIPWPAKGDSLLYRQVMPEHFRRVAGPHGVTGTVVIEAVNRPIDNDWLLGLADKEKVIAGVVGRLEPGTDTFAGEVGRLAKNRLFRGLRVGGQQLAEGLGERRYRDHLKLMADLDLELDVNGPPTILPAVARLGRMIPSLRVVIDHLANVRIDGKAPPDDWLEGMRDAARCKRVSCKVSALVEGTGRRDGKAPDDVSFYRPILDAVWDVFGEDRLLYGSNWPVSERFAPYGVVLGLVRRYFEGRGKTALGKFFSENARRVYHWQGR